MTRLEWIDLPCCFIDEITDGKPEDSDQRSFSRRPPTLIWNRLQRLPCCLNLACYVASSYDPQRHSHQRGTRSLCWVALLFPVAYYAIVSNREETEVLRLYGLVSFSFDLFAGFRILKWTPSYVFCFCSLSRKKIDRHPSLWFISYTDIPDRKKNVITLEYGVRL